MFCAGAAVELRRRALRLRVILTVRALVVWTKGEASGVPATVWATGGPTDRPVGTDYAQFEQSVIGSRSLEDLDAGKESPDVAEQNAAR